MNPTVPEIAWSTAAIYCSDRAMANGFSLATSDEWSNLGQGNPEAGEIPNATPRPTSTPTDSLEYVPPTGVKNLREAVANLYNHTYRQGRASQYTYENVCIVPSGRAGLSRVAAAIGDVYTSYQVPDYTAYDHIQSFKRLVPVRTALDPTTNYRMDIAQTRKDIETQGFAAILASNPRNPTSQVIKGKDLQELVKLGREGTTMILDESYSWYIYPEDMEKFGQSISSAEYVEDVNEDSIVIIDGFTKNWRLPGFRVCWVIGPKELVAALSQSGSFLDGGANYSLQLAAIPLLEPYHVELEKAVALQRHFKLKRDHVLKRLHYMHLDVDNLPNSTLYIWLNLERLPPPLNNGLTFFEELLKENTIVIPGIFFDPAHRRNPLKSPWQTYIRISFGPPLEDLDKGMDAFARVIKKAKKEGMRAIGRRFVLSRLYFELSCLF
ncbi:pyridoxal phosphate-dependent transferase [Mycena galericulata]|nr:pyridoxal phosphate-dependent transferase [Mycena galericulata]